MYGHVSQNKWTFFQLSVYKLNCIKMCICWSLPDWRMRRKLLPLDLFSTEAIQTMRKFCDAKQVSKVFHSFFVDQVWDLKKLPSLELAVLREWNFKLFLLSLINFWKGAQQRFRLMYATVHVFKLTNRTFPEFIFLWLLLLIYKYIRDESDQSNRRQACTWKVG